MSRAGTIVVGPVLALALAAAPGPAAAECAIPLWASLPDGGRVPTRGVFYLRNGYLADGGEWMPPRIEWSGVLPGFAHATQVGPQVIRVDYAGPAGARMTVRGGWDEPTVELTADWRPPPESPRVLLFTHKNTRDTWACGGDDVLSIQLDQPVAAVRVRWTVDDETVEVLEAPLAVGLLSMIHLGAISCGLDNFSLARLERRGELELHAVHFDGTVQWIRGMPREFALADAPEVLTTVRLTGVDESHPALSAR